jgi:chromosome segregation ATPase
MSEPANPNEERFQDIESVLVQLTNSQKELLRAQVSMSEKQDRTDRQLEQLAGQVLKLADHVVTFADHVERIDEIMTGLIEKVDSLAASQAHSDERLNALVAVVDDLVRRNGKSGTHPPQ